MSRLVTLFLAAGLVVPSVAARASITNVHFTGTGHFTFADNGLGIGDPATVSGSIHFSNGAPGQPPAVPDGFTGNVVLDADALFDHTESFAFTVLGSHHVLGVDTLSGIYPYKVGEAAFVGGKLSALYLYVDGDPDTSTLGPNYFSYFFDGASFGGDWTMSASSDTPEPAAWALMLTGFGLVGAAARRTRIVAA